MKSRFETSLWHCHRIEKSDLINVSKGNWNSAKKFIGGKRNVRKFHRNHEITKIKFELSTTIREYRNHLWEHDSSPWWSIVGLNVFYPFNHPNMLNNSVASRWVNFNLLRFAAMLEYWFQMKYDETRKKKIVHRKFTLQHLRLEYI